MSRLDEKWLAVAAAQARERGSDLGADRSVEGLARFYEPEAIQTGPEPTQN